MRMGWWRRNSNTVLTVVSITSFVGALVTTARAAPKIAKKIEKIPKAKSVKVELAPGLYSHEIAPVTKKEYAVEVVKACFPECVTPLIFSAVTVASIVGCKRQYSNNQALIASSYTMTKRMYDQHKEKINKIINDINVLDPSNPSALSEIEVSKNIGPDEKDLDVFFLEYSGRRFKSTRANVEEALCCLDEQFQMTGSVSFNDLYLYLGIAETKLGVEHGFIDYKRIDYPDHQESEHVDWEIRGVTRSTGIDNKESDKLEQEGEVIYLISFENGLEDVALYREIVDYEHQVMHSL